MKEENVEDERAFKTLNQSWRNYVNHARTEQITQGYIDNDRLRVTARRGAAYHKAEGLIIITAPGSNGIKPAPKWEFPVSAKDADEMIAHEVRKSGTVRVRVAVSGKEAKAFLTIKSERQIHKEKGKAPSCRRKEWEYEISFAKEAQPMLASTCKKMISKTRHYLDKLKGDLSPGKVKCTVDVFTDPAQDFQICEIEAVNPEKFSPRDIDKYPSFISRESEVTGKRNYTSHHLARKNPDYKGKQHNPGRSA